MFNIGLLTKIVGRKVTVLSIISTLLRSEKRSFQPSTSRWLYLKNYNSKREKGCEKAFNLNQSWHNVVSQSSMHACLTKTRCLQKKRKKKWKHPCSLFLLETFWHWWIQNFLQIDIVQNWWAKRICMYMHRALFFFLPSNLVLIVY